MPNLGNPGILIHGRLRLFSKIAKIYTCENLYVYSKPSFSGRGSIKIESEPQPTPGGVSKVTSLSVTQNNQVVLFHNWVGGGASC